MKRYVLGFAFDHLGRVALIRKNRPAWQAGKLNGVGGKAEDGEKAVDSMVREFLEETGVSLTRICWNYVGQMCGPDWHIDVFTTTHNSVASARTVTDEAIELVPMHRVLPQADEMIGNLSVLIQLCLLKDRPFFSFTYEGPH